MGNELEIDGLYIVIIRALFFCYDQGVEREGSYRNVGFLFLSRYSSGERVGFFLLSLFRSSFSIPFLFCPCSYLISLLIIFPYLG